MHYIHLDYVFGILHSLHPSKSIRPRLKLKRLVLYVPCKALVYNIHLTLDYTLGIMKVRATVLISDGNSEQVVPARRETGLLGENKNRLWLLSNKCLNQVIKHRLLLTCAPNSELLSHTSTEVRNNADNPSVQPRNICTFCIRMLSLPLKLMMQ